VADNIFGRRMFHSTFHPQFRGFIMANGYGSGAVKQYLGSTTQARAGDDSGLIEILAVC
jgi:hypothetical protein